ncbi:hypothetical protein DFH09DRAFT_1433782 [Mycena vulgaris]|nr:hypothetical protein DFH09DRAFT_1433782 [Mycena vulgaris]
MQDSTSQLTASILLGSLSLIPNTALRYTALGLATCLGILYAVYLKHPSTQLCQLEKMLATTEELIRGAKTQCPRDQLSLAEEWVRFLEVKQSTSVIKYNILATPRFTWTQYRLLSRDMAEHIAHVKSIHTAVQLTIEAERQRKLTAEIDDAEFVLCSNGHRRLPNSTDPSAYNSADSRAAPCESVHGRRTRIGPDGAHARSASRGPRGLSAHTSCGGSQDESLSASPRSLLTTPARGRGVRTWSRKPGALHSRESGGPCLVHPCYVPHSRDFTGRTDGSSSLCTPTAQVQRRFRQISPVWNERAMPHRLASVTSPSSQRTRTPAHLASRTLPPPPRQRLEKSRKILARVVYEVLARHVSGRDGHSGVLCVTLVRRRGACFYEVTGAVGPSKSRVEGDGSIKLKAVLQRGSSFTGRIRFL